MVRVANPCITAAIDAHGRVLARIPRQTDGYRDIRLPGALPPTFYARTGDLPAMSLVVLVFFLCGRRRGLRYRG